MKRIISVAVMSVIIVFSTLFLKIFIEIPDFFYGLGIGFGGALALVAVINKLRSKKYEKGNR